MGLISFVSGAIKAAKTIRKGPDPADATPAFRSLLADLERTLRWQDDECVGLSLAGGGAWGLGTIALVRRCQDRGLPIDFVAGVSAGALVAGMLAWRTSPRRDGLDVLVDREDETFALLWTCLLSMKPMERWLRAVTGGTRLVDTEARLLACHTRVMDGEYLEGTSGTVAQAVTAASAFAPLFAPFDYQREAVLDGGFAYNLPPRAELWSGGGGNVFFVTANPIPETPLPHRGAKLAVRQWLVDHVGLARRGRDFVYGVLHLFHRITEDCSKDSDLHCDLELNCWGPSDFDKMSVIVDRAEAQVGRKLSWVKDPAWAYHNWMYWNNTTTGRRLGRPGNPPPLGPLPPSGCP